jgi:trigger factor
MNRRHIVGIILGMLVCTGCSDKRGLQLCEVIEKDLSTNGICKSKILELGDFSKLSFETAYVEVSDEEVQQVVDDIMESYDRLTEYEDKSTVDEGDFVTIEYISRCDGKIVDENSEKTLKVGAGYFDENIEKSLIGAEKGITYSVSGIIPEGEGDLSGKHETTTITVQKICYVESEQLTDEFTKEKFQCDSVEEFYESIKKNRENQKIEAAEHNASISLMNQAIQLCKFDLNEDEVLNKALDIYKDYQSAATTYGADIEEYMALLGYDSSENIYDICYLEADEIIKRELLTGAVAFQENFTADGGEFIKWAENADVSINQVSEEILALEKKEYLENKVVIFLKNQ